MPEVKAKHTVHSLHAALQVDLTRCQTESERATCRAIGGSEIRAAAEMIANRRALTSGERLIAELYGYR